MINGMTFADLCDAIDEHNKKNNVTRQYADKHPLKCYIVFKNDSWPGWSKKIFTLQERTYVFRSDEKYFIPGLCGNSIFADCLDGKDIGVRLDWYLHEWQIDYCYIER